MRILWTFCIAALSCVPSFASAGENEPRTVTVDVAEFPPLVMHEGGNFSGFDIDFWNAIAEELGVSTTFALTDFGDIFSHLEKGTADAALAGITITDGREAKVDFSHSYFDSGLRILVSKESGSSTLGLLTQTYESGFGNWMLVFVIFILISALLIWWTDGDNDAIADPFLPGYFEALWFVIVTSTTVGYGDFAPKGWLPRAVAVMIMVGGITISGIFIGTLSSLMTEERIESNISSVSDLRGKTVATKAGTTSEKSLRSLGTNVVAVTRIEDAYPLLGRGEVDAVVFDAPSILYHAQRHADTVMIAGPLFDRQYYGIALPPGSPLREDVNRALLKLKRNGVYDSIYARWFGELER